MTSLNSVRRSRWLAGAATPEPAGITVLADRPDATPSGFVGESRVHGRGTR